MRLRERLFVDDHEGSGTGGFVDPVDDGGGANDSSGQPSSSSAPASAPVTREEFDALRDQTARVARRFNRALKASRTPAPTPAPASVDPAPTPAPVPKRSAGFFDSLSSVLPRKTAKPPTP